MKLKESFESPVINPDLKWYNEPTSWKVDDLHLMVSPSENTDFWQRTHYGFQADSGHFLFVELAGDFEMEVEVTCEFRNQYDQAGLMVRVSDQCWVKSSVEYEPDELNKLGVVVTNHGYSDWSTQEVPDEFNAFKLRISRKASDYKIAYYHAEDNSWVQLRMFHLDDQPSVQAGIYCCSPKQSGFKAFFKNLSID